MNDKRVEALGLAHEFAAREGLGRVAYEAYRAYSGGKSLITGGPIPPFEYLASKIRAAWTFGAVAVRDYLRGSESPFPGSESDFSSFQILPSRPVNVAFSISLANAPIGTKVTHLGADGSRTIVEVSDPNLPPSAASSLPDDVPVGETPPPPVEKDDEDSDPGIEYCGLCEPNCWCRTKNHIRGNR